MTEITMSEIKIIGIQVILMAILGAFMLLYAASPVNTETVPNSTTNQTTSVSASDQSWISNLISIPEGMDVLFLISVIVISPFVIFDAIIALRFAKDIVSNWL